MALTDSAVILPGRGYLFSNATVGAAPPADTQAELDALVLDSATLATGWNNLGHTSRENSVALDKDGDDPEVKGSWQSSSLRQTAGSTTWFLNIPALQLDNEVLNLYFGEGDVADPDVFHVLPSASPEERALFVVLVDGANRAALYIPKASMSSDDAPEFNPEDFVEFTIRATILDHSGSNGLMSWYRTGLGTP